jgi:anti-sigma factor RsiW
MPFLPGDEGASGILLRTPNKKPAPEVYSIVRMDQQRGKRMDRTGTEDVDDHEVNAYIDNQLPRNRAAAVEAFLRANPECAARLAADRRIVGMLRHCAAVPARSEATDRLRDELTLAVKVAADVRLYRARRKAAVAASRPVARMST